MTTRRRAVLAVLCASLMAACASQAKKADPPKSKVPFTPNITTYALPLTGYTPDYSKFTYAGKLVFADCMRAHGITFLAVNPQDAAPKNQNSYGLTLFDLDLAKAYGYHGGPIKQDPAALPPYNPTGAALATDQACARNTNGKVPFDQSNSAFVQELIIEGTDIARQDTKVLAALKTWRSCMLPLGLPDLPTTAEGVATMPTPSQAKRFGFGAGGSNSTSDQPYEGLASGPDEIREATFDAQCRESSGYTRTLYDTEVNAELALMNKNGTRLDQALVSARDENDLALKIIREHGR